MDIQAIVYDLALALACACGDCMIVFSMQEDSASLSSDSGDLELGGDPSVEGGLEDEDEQFGSDDDGF